MYHTPVLLKEVISFLDPRPGGTYVDATVGGGGHAEAVLERSRPTGRIIGFDRDGDAIEAADKRLEKYGGRVALIRANFSEMGTALKETEGVDGILFDLGISSHQIDSAGRGFSLKRDGPLDMRMDRSSGRAASDVINSFSAEELKNIIRKYGEEKSASRIAGAIVKARQAGSIESTLQLKKAIEKGLGRMNPKTVLNSVTRAFQALRIEVNGELDSLKAGLVSSIEALKPGGKLIVISYHSLEDRIVKEFFRRESAKCLCPREAPVCVCGHKRTLKLLTRKPVIPGEEEISINPRARSAKLRAAERVSE